MPTNENANFNELFVRDKIISTGPVELADEYRNPILKTNGNGPVEVLRDLTIGSGYNINLGSGYIDGGGSVLGLATDGSGSGYVNLYDAANAQSLLQAHEGGPVEVTNAPLQIDQGDTTDSTIEFTGNTTLKVLETGATDSFKIQRSSDGMNLLYIDMDSGGPVQVPNSQMHTQRLKAYPGITTGEVGSSTNPAMHIGGNGAGLYLSGGEVYVVDETGNSTLLS